MAELVAVQCPRCERMTVAGHRDCLVCGRIIHPEADPHARIHFSMVIRGREVLFYPNSMARLWSALIYSPGPILGGSLLAFLFEGDLAAVSFRSWAVFVLGTLAWLLIAGKFPRPKKKELLKLDRRGIHFPTFEDVMIPWGALVKTSGRISTVRLYGSRTRDILFHLNQKLSVDIKKNSSLWYDRRSAVLILRWVLLDADFVPKAVDFFGPILTQER